MALNLCLCSLAGGAFGGQCDDSGIFAGGAAAARGAFGGQRIGGVRAAGWTAPATRAAVPGALPAKGGAVCQCECVWKAAGNDDGTGSIEVCVCALLPCAGVGLQVMPMLAVSCLQAVSCLNQTCQCHG